MEHGVSGHSHGQRQGVKWGEQRLSYWSDHTKKLKGLRRSWDGRRGLLRCPKWGTWAVREREKAYMLFLLHQSCPGWRLGRAGRGGRRAGRGTAQLEEALSNCA